MGCENMTETSTTKIYGEAPYSKEIELIIHNRCGICEKKFPSPFEVLNGKKGCKHYEKWIEGLKEADE